MALAGVAVSLTDFDFEAEGFTGWMTVLSPKQQPVLKADKLETSALHAAGSRARRYLVSTKTSPLPPIVCLFLPSDFFLLLDVVPILSLQLHV